MSLLSSRNELGSSDRVGPKKVGEEVKYLIHFFKNFLHWKRISLLHGGVYVIAMKMVDLK